MTEKDAATRVRRRTDEIVRAAKEREAADRERHANRMRRPLYRMWVAVLDSIAI